MAPEQTRTHLFTGVDRALFVASFVAKLRGAGVGVSLGSAERTADGLDAVGPVSRVDLYWLLRVSLLSRQSDLDTFDAVFDAVFDFEVNRTVRQATDMGPAVQQSGDELRSVRRSMVGVAETGAGLPWATRPAIIAETLDNDDADDGPTLSELLPSELAHLADRPFDLLDEIELTRLAKALELAVLEWPRRVSRRRRASIRHGLPDLRSTLRHALATGGEPLRIHRRRRRERDRGVALIVDVSGSMESFVRPYLHVMRALAVARRAEVFTISTTVRRITPALRHRSAVEAMELASQDVGDHYGGTRLASSLRTLLRHRTWGSAVRGATVVIVSDGWDTEPPTELAVVMARLQRLAHSVIWVNPRIAAPGFEPLVGAMASALPFCDHFLSGHSVSAMTDVLEAIGAPAAGRRDPGRVGRFEVGAVDPAL